MEKPDFIDENVKPSRVVQKYKKKTKEKSDGLRIRNPYKRDHKKSFEYPDED